jgi:hypothetical protein
LKEQGTQQYALVFSLLAIVTVFALNQEILENAELHFFPNFVLGLPGDGGIEFWRQTYSGSTTLEQQKPVFVDVWRDGELLFKREFFPRELNNLRGRVMKMATFNYPPYSIIGD